MDHELRMGARNISRAMEPSEVHVAARKWVGFQNRINYDVKFAHVEGTVRVIVIIN